MKEGVEQNFDWEIIQMDMVAGFLGFMIPPCLRRDVRFSHSLVIHPEGASSFFTSAYQQVERMWER